MQDVQRPRKILRSIPFGQIYCPAVVRHSIGPRLLKEAVDQIPIDITEQACSYFLRDTSCRYVYPFTANVGGAGYQLSPNHPEKLGQEPAPLAPQILQNLTFPDGKALPPSLQLWLSFDAKGVPFFSGDQFVPTFLSESGGPAFDTLQRLLLPDRIYDLRPSGGDSMWFLYTGKPDEDGEYPVFVLDVDDQYLVELGAPNFAVWLASLYEVGGAGLSLGGPNLVGFASLIANSDLAALMRKQSRLNFGGYRYCEMYGTAVTADGQQTQWCTKDDLVFDLKARGFDEANNG